MSELSVIATPQTGGTSAPAVEPLTPTQEQPFALVARGSGYYVVYRDGQRLTQHITERGALAQALAEAEAWPDSAVKYVHEYEVSVSRLRRRIPSFSDGAFAAAGSASTAATGRALRSGAFAASGSAAVAAQGQAVSSGWTVGNQTFTVGTPANVPLSPPSGFGAPYSLQSGSLPTGVTINNAQNRLEYDGGGSPGSFGPYIIVPTASADADWVARSTAGGVVFTERFDTLQIGPGAGGGRYYNGDYGQRGFRDTTGPRCSGSGSLRLERRPGENFPNATGRYSRDTVDGGSLLPQFGPGDVFYVQFRYRIDQNWYDNQSVWGSGGRESTKIILLHSDNISCGQIEVSLQPVASWFSNRLLRVYTGCGSPGFFTETTSPANRQTTPYLWQQRWNIDAGSPWQREPGYEIAYGSGSSAGGLILPPNLWHTFDFRMQLPSVWGASDCRFEAWVTPAGQTQRQKFIAWIGPMASNGAGETNRMNNLTLTGYVSGGTASAATTGSCWYDEVIVSTQPIALPAALPVVP